MPTLRQVLPAGADCGDAAAMLDVDVVEVKLNDGAPCASHEGPYALWPGEGCHVHQWYVLANGKAAAVDEPPHQSAVVRIADLQVE